jgi:acyl-coenzyme A synthetase/AMP-(fatty) acid ligase
LASEAEILVLYGSTEVEPIAHIEANEMISLPREQEGVNVGKISSRLRYKFIQISKDEVQSIDEVQPNQTGELIVSGAHVCAGYYNDEAAFKKTKILDADGTIWHRTGDIGMVDEEGYLWFMGRVHNTILRAGQFLFPVKPEHLLKKLPFVRQAAFLGLEDPQLGEKTCVVVSLMPNIEDRPSLFYKTEKFLREHAIPVDEFRTVDEIPMDPRHHSKVEYGKLRLLL